MKKRSLLAVCSLMLCMFAGCLEATPLTDEEMDVTAEYAASLLLKYDKRYETSLYYAEEREVRLTPTPTPTPKPVYPTAAPEAEGKNPSGSASGEVIAAATPTPAPFYNQEEITEQLTELVSAENITLSCNGYELKDSVVSNNYFSLQAKEGRKYAVVSFTLQNNSDQEVIFDASDKGLVYFIDVNISTTFRASLSLLENDLQYSAIPVPAFGSAEAVLVFEIEDKETDTLHLIVRDKNDNTMFIKLK